MDKHNTQRCQLEVQRLLRKLREDKDMRQVEMAQMLRQPQSFVSKYESGERRLDIIEIREICEVIGISLSEFVVKLEECLK